MSCLIKHKWKYSDGLKDLSYELWSDDIKLDPVPVKIRICESCGKKQEGIIGYGLYNFKVGEYITWKEAKLTLEESRDFKINKLLK